MFFSHTATGWKRWRDQLKKMLLLMTLFLAFVAIYQTWSSRDSASLWFSLSFVSQASSALESQSSNLNRPDLFLSASVSSGPSLGDVSSSYVLLPNGEVEHALPPTLVQSSEGQPVEPNFHSPLCDVDAGVCPGRNQSAERAVELNETLLPSSEDESTATNKDESTSTNTDGSDNWGPSIEQSGGVEVLPDKLRKESVGSDGGILRLNSSSGAVVEGEQLNDDGILSVTPPVRQLTKENALLPAEVQASAAPLAGNLASDKLINGLNLSEKNFSSAEVQPSNTPLAGNVASDNLINGLNSSHAIPPAVGNFQLPWSMVNDSKMQADKVVSLTVKEAEIKGTNFKHSSPDPEHSVSSIEKPAWLTKLEDGLRAAKEVIANASPVEDSDLYPPLYHNVTTFRKSYAMMEQFFRVYIYHEGEPPLVHVGPTMGIYASEGRFIQAMQRSRRFIVKNPKEAHMFFLPYSVVNMVAKLYVPGSHSMLPLATFIKDYVNLIAAKHPYWNRTQGADHFFVSCHDWGPATARDHQELRQNAVKVVCNADLTEEYVLEKDASLPEIYIHSSKRFTRIGGPGPGKRPYLAFFAGQMHGRVRPVLLQYWKDKDPKMKIYEGLPSAIGRKSPYIKHMKLSRFCICAMGYEVNSPRIVEAIYYDCVPVIIADNFVLPFSDVLNWDSFSVTLQEREIPNLKTILLSISEEKYRAMQGRLKSVRKHFMWHDSPVKYDVFHMILHSVWLRRLRQIDSKALPSSM